MCAGRSAHWWGWHQLHPSWARRLVVDADIAPGDLVLDVGAGSGAITQPLLDAGARVVAIELHPARLAVLRDRFADEPVRVVRADATELRLPRRPFRVVANPPFAATTSLLRRLLAPGSRLEAAHLVLPDRVVQRWVAGRAPGAGRWHRTHDVRAGRRVPPSAFRPHATSGCRILVVRRRPGT